MRLRRFAYGLPSLVCMACGTSERAESAEAGAGDHCVDIVVNRAMFEDRDAWFVNGDSLPGGLWASDNVIHLAWTSYRFLDGHTTEYLTDTAPWLILSSFDEATGAVIRNDRYAPFPPSIKWGEGAIRSFAARADGTFVVGHEWVTNSGMSFSAGIGRSTDPTIYTSVSLAEVGPEDTIAAQTFAAWDGEAFALHAYGAPPQFSLHVARVDDQGNVLLPFTQYGITANVPPAVLSHRTATSPESGRTYSFDAEGDTILNGHLRDGSPLPGTESGPKTVVASAEPLYSASDPAIAADASGAWALWWQFAGGSPTVDYKILLQRLDLDGEEIGESATLPLFPLSDPGGIARWTLLSRGESVEVLAASNYSLYSFRYDGALGPPKRVLTLAPDDALDIRDMQAIEWQGETWLSYSQNKGDFYVRVLKVKDGCVYPAKPDLP